MHSIVLAACCLIAGKVHETSGAPLSGARVEARGASDASTTTGAGGAFALHVSPGRYQLAAFAAGYAPVTVTVAADHDSQVDIALEPLDSPTLRVIGRVTVDGRLQPIRGAIPSVTIARAEMEQLGQDRIVDALATIPGATFSRPDGGAASAISVVSLRGPDPSESLVALDGQLLNDGNTGDFDLSRFPVSAFSAIDVTEGLGPLDQNGANTFGGAINLVSLRPTLQPHQAFSLSGGSFGGTEAWYNATGTRGRLGYALALDDQHERGYVDRTAPLYSTTDPACAPCATHLGSAVSSHLGLGTLAWTFSQRAGVTARVFLLGDDRDQSGAQNGIDRNAADAGTPHYGAFVGPGTQTLAQAVRAYQLRGRAPLGAGTLTADLSASDNSVAVEGGGVSPYDLVHVDRRYNSGLSWQRVFPSSQFAFGGYHRYETLSFVAPPSLAQTIDVWFARGGLRPAQKLRLDGGVFSSHYTTFGRNLDGRFAAIYDADPSTSLRFSLGTGFRAPLLIERHAFPYRQLLIDGNGVFVGQGSPGEQPEHATEYEVGASHEYSRRATLDVSLYRTNLRNPVEVFYPFAAVAAGRCKNNSYDHPIPACVSYQSNVGNAVYQGAEVRYAQRLEPQHLFVTASYGLNVAYPENLTAAFANPSSGGNLVDGAQFLGIPQQQASFEADWQNRGWHVAADAVLRGKNNELQQGPFTLVNALAGRRLSTHVDLSLAATNVTNAVAGPFTLFGGGVPYRGLVGQTPTGAPLYGPIPTDALYVEPFAARLILTVRD